MYLKELSLYKNQTENGVSVAYLRKCKSVNMDTEEAQSLVINMPISAYPTMAGGATKQ